MRSYVKIICALLAPVLIVVPAHVLAQGTDESQIGEAVERHLPVDETFTAWLKDPD